MRLKKNGESVGKTVKSLLGKMGIRQWGILLLLGVLMTVIALPVSDKKGTESTLGVLGITSQETEKLTKTSLEVRLEEVLSQVEGVGKVQVMVMTGEEKDSQSFYSSKENVVTGVLIAAQGADNSVVSRNIVEAVMALFQIEAHKIKVMKMK